MEEPKDLLVEQDVLLVPASPGLRFANYLIDLVVFYALMFVVGILGVGMINQENMGTLYLISFTILIGYYTIMEGSTGGKTVGKYITRTRVVKEDSTTINIKDAFLRTLCRMVPFEPFSMFGGRPWHDKWTRTMVIKE